MGMDGLIKERAEAIEEYEGGLLDAALIGAAQRVEHYEMAGYGTVSAFAAKLGETEHVSVFNVTLSEEKKADEKLSGFAAEINAEANRGKVSVEVDKTAGGKKKSQNAA